MVWHEHSSKPSRKADTTPCGDGAERVRKGGVQVKPRYPSPRPTQCSIEPGAGTFAESAAKRLCRPRAPVPPVPQDDFQALASRFSLALVVCRGVKASHSGNKP